MAFYEHSSGRQNEYYNDNGNDVDDDDDDEEDLVLYKSQRQSSGSAASLPLPQYTQTSTSSTPLMPLPRRRHRPPSNPLLLFANQQQQQPQQEDGEPPVSCILDQQLLHNNNSGNDDDDDELSGQSSSSSSDSSINDQNAFDSLELLLLQEQQHQQQQQQASNKTINEEEPLAANPTTEEHHGEDQFITNNDEEEDGAQTLRLAQNNQYTSKHCVDQQQLPHNELSDRSKEETTRNTTARRFLQPRKKAPATNNNHEACSIPSKRVKRGFSSQRSQLTTTHSLALLEESRRFENRTKKRKQDTRQRKQPPTKATTMHKITMVRTKKSIVGSRPKHWGVGAATNKQSTDRRFAISQDKHERKAQLRRATQMPPPVVRPTTRSSKSSLLPAHPPTTDSHDTEKPSDSNPIANVSFAPAFLSQKANTKKRQQQDNSASEKEMDDVETTEVTFDASALSPMPGRYFPNNNNSNRRGSLQTLGSPPFLSPTPRKTRNKKGNGPLTKRLKQLRDSINGDMLRFRSGQFPFPTEGKAYDWNDPRNRAKSHMDVTILGGQSHTWWENHVTFRAFVHAHVVTKKQSCEEPCKNGPVWISFRCDYAREEALGVGSSIRIYNPIAFQSRRPGPEWMVIAQLCEPYPDCLPKLLDLATIEAKLV